jgi:hypothetical protein
MASKFSRDAYLLHLLLFLRSIVLRSFLFNHSVGYVDRVSVSKDQTAALVR